MKKLWLFIFLIITIFGCKEENTHSEELEQIQPDQSPSVSGTVYFRGFDGAQILTQLPEANLLKGPDLNWYGMKEIYVQDPDGYILCLGIPEGEYQSS